MHTFWAQAGKLENTFREFVQGSVKIEVALLIANAVVDEDAVENLLACRGGDFVGIGQAHQGQAKVADADVPFPLGTILQVDLHHVAVFVVDGQDELVLAGTAFVEVEAGGEGGVQGFSDAIDVQRKASVEALRGNIRRRLLRQYPRRRF